MAKASGGADRGARLRKELIFAGGALGAAALLVAVLVLSLGARIDAPTLGLAAAGAALIYALRGLFSMVQALAQPSVESALRAGGGRARAELRDEKKRVLRAIKELDFDYGMGKLSKEDYESVRADYQMRAIAVMRELDGGGELHPDLQAELERIERGEEAPGKPEDTPPEEKPAVSTCAHCEGENDLDAKFCKHCGKPIASEEGAGD